MVTKDSIDWQTGLMTDPFSEEVQAIITRLDPGRRTLFVEGPAGSGKTALAIGRIRHLLDQGVSPDEILILVPQRTLGTPYREALEGTGIPAGVPIEIMTVWGLVRRYVELFWPVVAHQAGFAVPTRPPVFLNLETAQYYMQRVAGPDLASRGFEGVTISQNRLVSQLIDNLNKAALVGFPAEEIADRLKRSWAGETSLLRAFDQAQVRALEFRRYCLEHNLLDFSLQVEVFSRRLLPHPVFRNHLFGRFRHLIADNVEENPPIAHDLLREWLPHCASALTLYDQDGGYRAFLGADPIGGYALKDLCQASICLTRSFVMSDDLEGLQASLSELLDGPAQASSRRGRKGFSILPSANPLEAMPRYQTQMLECVAARVSYLVADEGVPPGEIVVLAPFLSDALRFTLANRLQQHGLSVRSHRPSRALRDEPATRCLLTLAMLAHPHWKMLPTEADVVQALMQTIDSLDLVRADLFAQIVYRPRDGVPCLTSFDQIGPEAQERLTYAHGERYDKLRQWLERYGQSGLWAELDHFFSLLFGEVLSQPGYGFHHNFDAAGQTANLIESVRRFREVVSPDQLPEGRSLGQEYVDMVRQGVLAAQYEWGWQVQPEEAILLAPAYTFLMYNRPVDYQFWINAGSTGWWERIYQPLTHPYVLSRHWPVDSVWNDANEFAARQTALRRLVVGLIRRCRKGIYLGMSSLNEQGYEESGPLLHAFNRLNRQATGAAHG